MALVRKKRLYNENEAGKWLQAHVPATGIMLEGHDDMRPYWTIMW